MKLIGTATNLLVDGVARANGQPGFGIFDMTGVGLVAMAAGVATMVVLGPKLLPVPAANDIADRHQLTYLTELALSADLPRRHRGSATSPLSAATLCGWSRCATS